MPYLKRLFEQSGFSPHSLGRIARLMRRCIDADALAIYLMEGDDLQRAFSSRDYPASTAGERAFLGELVGSSITSIRDVTSDEPTWAEWAMRTTDFRWWASAPIQPPSREEAFGYLVVADTKPRTLSDEDRERMVDATRLIVDHLEARRLNARMAQLDRMTTIGTLATGVAHEINNPLSFVGGNIQFALRTVDEKLDVQSGSAAAEIVEALEDALAGSRRVRDVVRDLHRLARGSRGGDDFTIEPVSIEQALETSLNIARNHIERCAHLVVEVDDLPPVMGNEPKLGQVFLNLLVNAAQAIPPGDIESNEVRIEADYDDDEIVVAVSDSGEGIPPEHLDSIFEPFFSTKASEEGTGLGLAISKYIVTTLGGDIEVDSSVGEGTTFRVILPTATSHGPPES
ncbi:MAG: sensor histidine kinase [Persicimonas sp.]